MRRRASGGESGGLRGSSGRLFRDGVKMYGASSKSIGARQIVMRHTMFPETVASPCIICS